MKRAPTPVVTGTLNGVVAGGYLDLPVWRQPNTDGRLILNATLLAQTTSLAVTVAWFGSNDAAFSSPTELANVANTSSQPAVTGTAGVDLPRKISNHAPHSAASFKFVRARLRVTGATGTSADTYSAQYDFIVDGKKP